MSRRKASLTDRLPTLDEQVSAKQLQQVLATQAALDDGVTLTIADPAGDQTAVSVAPAVANLLIEALGHIGNGGALLLEPVPLCLSTQQAAALLNVPRSHLVSLLKNGVIASQRQGPRRTVNAADLLKYKSARDADRAGALENLAQLDSALI